MARNPLKDAVAIVGVGSTPYGRNLQRSELSLALEASLKAIDDAGIDRSEIDGICGSGMTPVQSGGGTHLAVQGALGIEKTTWVMNGWLLSCVPYAVEAVFTGTCDTVLIVQSYVRGLEMSRSAANDPFRARAAELNHRMPSREGTDFAQRWNHSGEPYAAWMRRYLHDYSATKEVFGRIAVNNRSHASRNPNAAMRTPMTMDDYLGSRAIWDPMQMFDMDVPVDCGEALIVTTAERARDLEQTPIYVHAMSMGGTRVGEYYENGIGWTETAPWIAMEGLWARSDLRIQDLDLFIPYDGYTVNAVSTIEAAGFCKPGEAQDLFASSWDSDMNALKLLDRTYVSTNGGSLSQGRAGGSNYFTEAVRQLRGHEGDRQIPNAKVGLVAGGSFYHDPVAVVLHAD